MRSKKKYNLIVVACAMLLHFAALAQEPKYSWRFDETDFFADSKRNRKLNVDSYKPAFKKIQRGNGMALQYLNSKGFIVTNMFDRKAINSDFTLEFLFNGKSFVFQTFPAPDFRFSFSYGRMQLSCKLVRGSKAESMIWNIPLKGSGIASYDHLSDGEWHKFQLVIKRRGQLFIYIDGDTDDLFQKKVGEFDGMMTGGGDGFRGDGSFDDINFYDVSLDLGNLASRSIVTAPTDAETGKKAPSDITAKSRFAIDANEFAPGYPEYNVQAIDQLKSFPAPRYAERGFRNFPWMDITYLHRELPGNGGKGFGKLSPKKAVEMAAELSENWNYYFEVPCLRIDSINALKKYTDRNDIFQALIAYANAHQEVPVSTIIMQIQNKPVHAGYDSKVPFIRNYNLDEKYYLKDRSGAPVIFEKRKIFSPLAPLDFIQKDAFTTLFYLGQLKKHLHRKIDMLNENGEWYGHSKPIDLFRKDPSVSRLVEGLKMSESDFNGWLQNRFDSAYIHTIVSNELAKGSKYTFYNVSATASTHWPAYKQRIYTNSVFGNSPRSTPSFYPSRPDNWQLASGPLNGYGRIAEGRVTELKYGVSKFAPFVCAGWSLEENNIRPAQWLGLLKAMGMLGADFFHVGYFNTSGTRGWPNGVGPNDPRGYIYQAAMPAYTQAIFNSLSDFIEKGELLVDPRQKRRDMPYTFQASAQNHLVMVRKLGRKYLIFGSVQPISNSKGNAPLEAKTSIELEGRQVTFLIRRQGSIYILDANNPDVPIFWQLDKWHQYEHPYFWAKSYSIEAEQFENKGDIPARVTEGSPFNYLNFSCYVPVSGKDKLKFTIHSREKSFRQLVVRCRKKSGRAMLTVTVGNKKTRVPVENTEWKDVVVELTNMSAINAFPFEAGVEEGQVDIDYFTFVSN